MLYIYEIFAFERKKMTSVNQTRPKLVELKRGNISVYQLQELSNVN